MSEKLFKTVQRTWWERLFTRPWTPRQATKQVRDHEAESARRLTDAIAKFKRGS